MGQQEKNGNQREDQQNVGGDYSSSSRKKPDAQRDTDREADRTIGSGASGEGAGSALEAMLKRRQSNIEPVPGTGASPVVPPQGATKKDPDRSGAS